MFRYLRKNWAIVCVTFFYMSLVYLNLLHFTGGALGGNSQWMPLPSSFFGVPVKIADKQQYIPLFTDEAIVGWDGQFYFYMANDLLAQEDTVLHLDQDAYRYQRIGVPFLSWLLSKCLFADQVTVSLFVWTQILLLGAAVFYFVLYLKMKDMSVLYVVPWLFSFGVQVTLQNCLVDAGADALVVISLIAFLRQRWMLYSAAMTLGCLAREGFASIAGMVFLIYIVQVVRHYAWKEAFQGIILLSLPWLSVSFWIAWLTVLFGHTPASQACGILDIPGRQWLYYVISSFQANNMLEFGGLWIYFFTCVLMLVLIVQGIYCKTSRAFSIVVFPYTFLLLCFGRIVMEACTGYLKGISALYAIMVLLLSLRRTISLRIFTVCFVLFLMQTVWSFAFYFPRMSNLYPNIFALGQQNRSEAYTIVNYTGGDIQIRNVCRNVFETLPLQKWAFYRDSYTLNVCIQNTSNEVYHRFDTSEHEGGVYLQGRWYQGGMLVKADTLYQLANDIPPGGELSMDMQVLCPENYKNLAYKVYLIQRRKDRGEELAFAEGVF